MSHTMTPFKGTRSLLLIVFDMSPTCLSILLRDCCTFQGTTMPSRMYVTGDYMAISSFNALEKVV